MADLQELFSRLKAQSSESAQAASHGQSPWTQPQIHQQPHVSSPLMSPPVYTPNPIHSSNIMSPANQASAVASPAPDSNRANLLNLLKFNGQTGLSQGSSGAMDELQNVTGGRTASPSLSAAPDRNTAQTHALSASDIMASLQQKSSSRNATPSPLPILGAEKSTHGSNQQNLLLNLLTKNKSQQSASDANTMPEWTGKPIVDGSKPRADNTSIPYRPSHASVAAPNSSHLGSPQNAKPTMFGYVNPFDQLHSSSPLNRTRTPKLEGSSDEPKKLEILKHGRDASSANGEATAPATKSRKIDQESFKEATSVSQALEGVGEKVDKQVEQALAKADITTPQGLPSAYEENLVVKREASDDVESNWESAEDENVADQSSFKVEVYNFPMKPFVSIQIKQTKTAQAIRQENFMVIAQLKKEFDQIDRGLVTASQTHIVYAQVATKKDNGGFRIIRQDTGDHKQVFRSSGERIFNVQLCSSGQSGHDVEAVLGTGVHGSVFWTSLAKSRGDLFKDDDVEAHGFILPPVATTEENTSGSPVKTRAKLSSRHPEFFAVARGKQIFIIAPDTVKDAAYCHADTRKVKGDEYFADHTLKLNTGKAGKDFCFSEDDSMIVSLDKNGRFKFWDIRELTNRACDTSENKHDPVELRDPMWTLTATTSGSKADEKPSVSSIMFLDKDRPMANGLALRYIIIGFKQNHILQLWDLGLGKAVQEVRLPHDKDSDGICSISYHPKTGIIGIGHPTRNSIYFVHLSAPKYNIPKMDQARYISMLARGDPNLPKPESTAIMSGLREFSFEKAGQLRSVDMLRVPVENGSERDTADETLFELYIMHSKGVVGVGIKREDLGWDNNSKMVNPRDALAEGVVEVSDFVQPLKPQVPSEHSSNAEIPKPAKAAASVNSEASKPVEVKKEMPKPPTTASNGAARDAPLPEAPAPSSKQIPVSATPLPTTPGSYATAAKRINPEITDKGTQGINGEAKSSASSATMPNPVADDIQHLVSKQFDTLYQRFDADKRVQEAAAGAKQDALLRLVSSTLTENVDRSLSEIIAKRIEQDVVPALTQITSKAIDAQLAEAIPKQLGGGISSALKAALPNALRDALQGREVHQNIANITANQVATKVQQQVSALLQQSLPDMASKATQKMVSELESRMNEKLRQAETQRRHDHTKIDELTSLVRSLSTTIQNMTDSQTAFQEHILKMQREPRSNVESAGSGASNSATQESTAEPEDEEVANMTNMIASGRYEDATIQWISSDRQADIFDKLFVRLNPSYLQHVSPLVGLTVSAAVTSSFESFVVERLDWLAKVLNSIDIRDSEIMDVAPRIMDVLSQRLQGAYMRIAEVRPDDPALRTISALNRQVSEIRRL